MMRLRAALLAMVLLVLAGGAESADDGGKTSVVILPPIVIGDASQHAVALGLCDQLADALQGKLTVVSRELMDRLLEEHKKVLVSGGTFSEPIVSAELAARVEVDVIDRPYRATLAIVGLSSGTVLARRQFPWPPKDAGQVVAEMAEALVQGEQALRASKHRPRLRVRLLFRYSDESPRLASLAQRLEQSLVAGVEQSEWLQPIRHVEARTAKEESLLILMGLGRVAGGRQFLPHADAVVEVTLEETHAAGVSFEGTPLRVTRRVSAGGKVGKPSSNTATVRDLDKLIARTKASLLEELRGLPDAQAAVDAFADAAARRKQAEAELRTTWRYKYQPTVVDYEARLAALAAAVKLDPTWEEAAYQYATCCADYLQVLPRSEARHHTAAVAAFREALGYLERFPLDHQHRGRVAARLMETWQPAWSLRVHPDALTSEERLAIEMMSRLLEVNAVAPPEEQPASVEVATARCLRGMELAGMPDRERLEWLMWIIDLRYRMILEGRMPKDNLAWSRLVGKGVSTCLAQGQRETALDLVARLRSAVEDHAVGVACLDLRSAANKLGDARFLADLDRWQAQREDRAGPVGRIPPWPLITFSKAPKVKCPVEVLKIECGHTHSAGPLGIMGNRLFVGINLGVAAASDWESVGPGRHGITQRLGVAELGAGGGASVIRYLPVAPTRKPMRVLSSAIMRGQLYLGTEDSGLAVWDPDADSWTILGGQEGLPTWRIDSLYAIDDDTLLCSRSFTLDVRSGKIVKVGRLQAVLNAKTMHPEWLPCHGDSFAPTSLVRLRDRTFVMLREELREVALPNKVLRSWKRAVDPDGQGYDPLRDVHAFSDIPDGGRLGLHIVAAGDGLFITGDRVVYYQPATDTWYGPLTLPGRSIDAGCFALTLEDALWMGRSEGVLRIRTKEFLDEAKKHGLVTTTKRYLLRRKALVDAADPMAQAYFYYCQKEYDKALSIVKTLTQPPKVDLQASLLGGLICQHGLKQPEWASAFYEILTQQTDQPAYTRAGLKAYARMLQAMGQRGQARELEQRVNRRLEAQRLLPTQPASMPASAGEVGEKNE